ncbi:MAG: hypothetical protein PF489_16510 [Salinivirgaceae bacterium]|jgi:hypothetical protein|nr:hypothetical protein [Salinivirgaceae bacterium]
MKTISKVVIIALLVLVSNLVIAQTTDVTTDSHHEISIVVDDIFAPDVVPVSYDYYDSYVMYYSDYALFDKYTTKIGLGYKFHFGDNALRSKFSYGKNNEKIDDEDDAEMESKNMMLNIFLGYERNVSIGKAQIFYGLDLNLNKYTSNLVYEDDNSFYNSKIESTGTNTGYGISPLIGVRYYITPNFSLSTEIKYSVETYRGENKYEYYEFDDYDDYVYEREEKTTSSGLNTKFGPLGQLSVNIHF